MEKEYQFEEVLQNAINCLSFLTNHSSLIAESCNSRKCEAIADYLNMGAEVEWISIPGAKLKAKSFISLCEAISRNQVIDTVGFKRIRLIPKSDQFLVSLGVEIALRNKLSLVTILLNDLEIDDDGVEIIAKAIINSPVLKWIYFNENKISSKGIAEISTAIEKSSSLEYIDFSKNNIDSKGAYSIGNAIAKSKYFKCMDLTGNKDISFEGICHIANGMGRNYDFESIGFEECSIDDNGISEILKKLGKWNSYQHLRLLSNKLGPKGGMSIANFVRSAFCKLELISLGKNNIGADACGKIADAVKSCKSLKSLGISENNIGNYGASKIGEMLEINKTLQKLFLWDDNIGDEGLVDLSRGVMKNSSLKKLELDGNKINMKGAEALANAISEHKTLEKLSLNNTEIDNDCAIFIGKALAKNDTLKEIYLKKNSLEPIAVWNIAEGIKNNKSLIDLEMGNNRFGSEAAAYIGNMLEFNNTLEALGIEGNSIQTDGMIAFANGLRKNKKLLELCLGCQKKNDFDGLVEILKAFGEDGNQTLRVLMLTEMDYTDECSVPLHQFICKNHKAPSHLYLDENKFSRDGLKFIAEAFKMNTSLLKLGLSDNGVTEEMESWFDSRAYFYLPSSL